MIIRTEFIKLSEIFSDINKRRRLSWYSYNEKNPNYNPNDNTIWAQPEYGKYYNPMFGGFQGKIQAEWYIPEGCRVERLRLIGFDAETD